MHLDVVKFNGRCHIDYDILIHRIDDGLPDLPFELHLAQD